jgi:hypothetical protein
MLDLFGEVPVTHDDVRAWVCAIAPAWTSSERSYAFYVSRWNVADKVRTAKLAGTFELTIENARSRRAFLGRHFGMSF